MGCVSYDYRNYWVNIMKMTNPGGIEFDAQVSVGPDAPDASAVIDFQSTTQGLLIPRMTTTERDAISSPADI